jgi:hypothetical protein
VSPRRVLLILALLAIVAYLPAMRQPLLEDDYPHLTLAQHFGDPANWRDLAAHPFRFRATAEWFLYYGYRVFGMHAPAYYAATILLHVLATWLVYAMGIWPLLGYELSAWAAGFFAIYEGHQEAVMWISACNELWQFLFVAGAFVCWLHFLFGEGRRAAWYAGGLVSFAFALLSKESASAFVVLLALPLLWRSHSWLQRPDSSGRIGREEIAFLPYLALAAAGLLWLYSARHSSFRFQDGSFSIHSPFWLILPSNYARLFWFWGLTALAWAWMENRRAVAAGLLWAALALAPYGFLTYSMRIPSRQTYLASAGVAWIVGAALQRAAASHRKALPVLCAALLLHNVGYLWIKKRRQYLERAEPTERLIALARRTTGPIYVKCFPRPRPIAEEAVHLAAGKPASDVIWSAEEAQARHAEATFCYEEK